MKFLVTGAKGFIGKNLICELKNQNHTEIFEYDLDTDSFLLDSYCRKADIVYHIAGINRPEDSSEYRKGNYELTARLLKTLKKYQNSCPVIMSSSISAIQDSEYGRSKKAAEDILFQYGNETGADIYIYRLPNVFGKWQRPNYNSVIATFCYNIARSLPITIHETSKVMNLAYIDDVIKELISITNRTVTRQGKFCVIPTVHTIKLTKIASLLYSFQKCREERTVPDMSDPFVKKLYSTYLSYLPENELKYGLSMHQDDRGSFTEFIKSKERGQISINIAKPGVIKGNHWHHTKHEKFLVVKGTGVIRLRKVTEEQVIEYHVSGEKLEVVDIPCGYTHSIENLGDTDMITVMWANECFDIENPDTYRLEVSQRKEVSKIEETKSNDSSWNKT